jgi:hypothetical protein
MQPRYGSASARAADRSRAQSADSGRVALAEGCFTGKAGVVFLGERARAFGRVVDGG